MWNKRELKIQGKQILTIIKTAVIEINKTLFPDKTSRNTYIFTDLAPLDYTDNAEVYLEAMNEAIAKNDRVRNIAISGPYGAGKSTIINSFLCKNPSVKEKSLRIALADFLTLDAINNNNNNTFHYDEENIQKAILKQLFYKVDSIRIPLSRYNKLHKAHLGKILKCCFFIVAFITVFFYQYILGFIANVQKSLSIFHLSPVVQLIAEIFPICFGLYLVYIFTEWFLRFTGKFSIQEIYFGNNSGLKGTRENKESIFDKNLEEIIYFFEQTPYRYIFFEDLDRLPNLSILIHLRELNNLLNNDKSVNGPIKFIYAIRDDVFRGEDRTYQVF